MNAATCQSCHHLLPPDAAYCPDCGTAAPEVQATFVLESEPESASDTDLFAKPKEQTTLSWGPILVGLMALFVVVAVVVTLSGTGGDIASAPTPTPEPSPTPSPQPQPTPSENPAKLFDDTSASSDDAYGYLGALPDDLVRVEAGSDADDYIAVLRSLGQSHELRGVVVFATATEATRLDLETGNVIQIPLDGRRFLLGGRTGIISTDPGRTVVAHRWDAVDEPIEVAAGYYDLLGSSWIDPNGWELVAYSASGQYSIVAPWETSAPGSRNIPNTDDGNRLAFGGGFDLDAAQPRRWTWDDGWVALPWDAVLARNEEHLLVQECDAPGECVYKVVEGQNVLFTVDQSLSGSVFEGHVLALSPRARALQSNIDETGFEIIDLETAATTPLPVKRIFFDDGNWLDDLFVIINIVSEGQSHLILDRNGEPIADLRWADDASGAGGLQFFAPLHGTEGSP